MKIQSFSRSLFPVIATMALAAGFSHAVTISVVNSVPNGTASGGSGSGAGALTTTLGSISTNRGLPVTTYSVTNVDLSGVGGGAAESFSFTVSYAQTGGTAVQFTSFGNVSVTGGASDQFVDSTEDLTMSIALITSTFPGLSLTGFTSVRLAGITAGSESVTVSHGGAPVIAVNSGTDYVVSGTSMNFDPVTTTDFNLQRFSANFEAIPEPSAMLLGGLGMFALLRRRR